jgi:DNA-binding PadR family transcriptional regulator
MNLEKLSKNERETYEFIRDSGEIMTRNLPNRSMFGVISSLKNKGLVEVYKKYTSNFRRKKKKFVRIRENKK